MSIGVSDETTVHPPHVKPWSVTTPSPKVEPVNDRDTEIRQQSRKDSESTKQYVTPLLRRHGPTTLPRQNVRTQVRTVIQGTYCDPGPRCRYGPVHTRNGRTRRPPLSSTSDPSLETGGLLVDSCPEVRPRILSLTDTTPDFLSTGPLTLVAHVSGSPVVVDGMSCVGRRTTPSTPRDSVPRTHAPCTPAWWTRSESSSDL